MDLLKDLRLSGANSGPLITALEMFARHWLVLSAFFLAGVILWTLRQQGANPLNNWLRGLAALSLGAGFLALIPSSNHAALLESAPLTSLLGAVLFGTAVFLVRWGPALRLKAREGEFRFRSNVRFKHKERMRG